MNSAEDFLLLLLHTHTIAAAKRIHSLTSVTELAHASRCYTRKKGLQRLKDGVYVYAVELLTFTLFWHGFHDAIKEGDGDRILRYWKFFTCFVQKLNSSKLCKRGCPCTTSVLLLFIRETKAMESMLCKYQRFSWRKRDLHM